MYNKNEIPAFKAVKDGKKLIFTKEEQEKNNEALMRFIRLSERAQREKRNIPLTEEELNKE